MADESNNDDEDVVEMDEEDDSGSDMQDDADNNVEKKTYLPGQPLKENEELVCDESAYIMYHQAQTVQPLKKVPVNLSQELHREVIFEGAPCLSFDIMRDNLGEAREQFPMTCYMVSGTQAERGKTNHVLVMKMSNLNKTQKSQDDEDDDDDDESEDDDLDELPELEIALVKHSSGSVNRIRCTLLGEKPVAASWSEKGKVHIWDLSRPLHAVNDSQIMSTYTRNEESPLPIFTFSGHQVEGFAVDWCKTVIGRLATGDCKKNIHIWNPQEGGTWTVDQRPYTGHTSSVEDIQWSPNEANILFCQHLCKSIWRCISEMVTQPYQYLIQLLPHYVELLACGDISRRVFSSCSVDKSIRIWDARAEPHKACMLTVQDAHDRDINVIHWNRNEPFILSGGDDGILKVWDLRQFQHGKPAASLKHHSGSITSVEWHPSDSSVFAACGSDDQLTIWDLAVEKDTEAASGSELEPDVPPQLLFIHQGQTDIKELHWHPQLTGVIISTALSGFNVFRTISV